MVGRPQNPRDHELHIMITHQRGRPHHDHGDLDVSGDGLFAKNGGAWGRGGGTAMGRPAGAGRPIALVSGDQAVGIPLVGGLAGASVYSLMAPPAGSVV